LVEISPDLPVGDYEFIYYYCKPIRIKVHEGERWKLSPNYLLKKDCILKVKNNSKYLICDKFDHKDDEINLRMLCNNPSQVRVHVFGYSYYPTKSVDELMNNTYNTLFHDPNDLDTQKFDIKKNSNNYLNSKILSDEIQYVLERK